MGVALAAKLLRVRNLTRGTVVAERCRVADNPLTRGVGLLLTARLSEGEGLLLTDTATITMFFMRYPIDVAFVDARWHVVDVAPRLGTWVPARRGRRARSTLELPVDALQRSGTQVGDDLSAEALD